MFGLGINPKINTCKPKFISQNLFTIFTILPGYQVAGTHNTTIYYYAYHYMYHKMLTLKTPRQN